MSSARRPASEFAVTFPRPRSWGQAPGKRREVVHAAAADALDLPPKVGARAQPVPPPILTRSDQRPVSPAEKGRCRRAHCAGFLFPGARRCHTLRPLLRPLSVDGKQRHVLPGFSAVPESDSAAKPPPDVQAPQGLCRRFAVHTLLGRAALGTGAGGTPTHVGAARTDASPAHVKRWPLGRVACPWGVERTSVREGEVTGTCIACCLKTLETNPVLLWGETTSSNRSSHVLGLDSTFLQGREHQAKHKRTRKIPPNSAASLKVTQQQNRKFQRTHRACV